MKKLKDFLWNNIASLMVDILLLSAAVLVSVGVGMLSAPVGIIAAGVWCFVLAILLAKGTDGGGKH